MPDGVGGVAVGRCARMASSVAVFTVGVPVGGTDCAASLATARLVADGVGGNNGDGMDKGEANGERDAGSSRRAVRHTSTIANNPTTRPDMIKKRVRRLTGLPLTNLQIFAPARLYQVFKAVSNGALNQAGSNETQTVSDTNRVAFAADLYYNSLFVVTEEQDIVGRARIVGPGIAP